MCQDRASLLMVIKRRDMSVLPSLFLNLTLLVSLSFLCGMAFTLERGKGQPWIQTVLSVLSSLLLVAFPGHTQSGYPLDLRFVPGALIALGFGPKYSAPVFGVLLLVGVAQDHSLISPAVVGAALSLVVSAFYLRRRRAMHWDIWEFVPFVLAASLPALLVPEQRSLLGGATLPLLIGNVLGVMAASWVLISRLRLIQLTWQLGDLAHTDTLTGLSNRRQYERDLRHLPINSHLLLLDLDHFKRVNDQYGHATGDEALSVIGALLGAIQTQNIQAYRIGGEEFALLIKSYLPKAAVHLSLDLLRRVREARILLQDDPEHNVQVARGTRPTLSLTCSIGLARLEDAHDQVGMFRRADAALYQSKYEGRDRLTVARPATGPINPAVTNLAPNNSTHIEVAAGQGGSHALWNALLDTLTELNEDRDLNLSDHQRLLESAVMAVPGAEAGTLSLLRRGQFEVMAQSGYSDALLGRLYKAADQRAWYGGSREDYLAGQPRLLAAPGIIQAGGQHMAVTDVRDIKANLTVPVVVDGHVAAQLNLDSRESSTAFGADSLALSGLFGRQLSTLLTAQKRRAERVSLEQALSGVQDLSRQLQQAGTPQVAYDMLVDQLHEALWVESVQLYSVGALGLELLAAAGTARLRQSNVMPGEGLCWRSVERQQMLNIPSVRCDMPGFSESLSGPQTLLLLPMRSPSSPEDANAGGEVWGLLATLRPVGRPFTASDEACCARFADLTSSALYRLEREGLESVTGLAAAWLR
jgi:diguanylate cyclase (GGDEF)-like protein